MMRKEIGERLRHIRRDKGLTQRDLGEILGIKFQHVSKYERGESVPTWENLIKIIEYFSVNINWFLTGKGEMYIKPASYPEAEGQPFDLKIRDKDSSHELEEIVAELEKDEELKKIIHQYIKNYKGLKQAVEQLKNKAIS